MAAEARRSRRRPKLCSSTPPAGRSRGLTMRFSTLTLSASLSTLCLMPCCCRATRAPALQTRDFEAARRWAEGIAPGAFRGVSIAEHREKLLRQRYR